MNIGFRLKKGRDDIIIDWLEAIGENDRSYYIREALRSYLSGAENKNIAPTNVSSLRAQSCDDKNCGKIEAMTRKRSNDDKEKIPDLEANLNGWLDKV